MFISKQLKENNIAEYLIYMWQVEDMIRANGCDMEKIKKNIVDSYPLTEEQKVELTQWYIDLIEMMRRENVMEKGHLQINKNIITWLTDLHLQLLRSSKFPYYSAAYYKALPYIVELRAKGANKEEPELETCFEALYGILLLKLQKKEISEETKKAQQAISGLLAMLSNYYIASHFFLRIRLLLKVYCTVFLLCYSECNEGTIDIKWIFQIFHGIHR